MAQHGTRNAQNTENKWAQYLKNNIWIFGLTLEQLGAQSGPKPRLKKRTKVKSKRDPQRIHET